MKTSLLTRLYRYFALKPSGPQEVWQTTKTVYLRSEKTIECDWFGYTHWDVYALHQTSLTTGNTRVITDWRVT